MDSVLPHSLADALQVGALDGQGLFRCNVQLALGAGQDDGGALMVGSSDSHHIELFLVQHLDVIGITPDGRGQLRHSCGIGIGDGNQLNVGQAFDGLEDLADVSFHSGDADADFFGQPEGRDGGGCEQGASSKRIRHVVIVAWLRRKSGG